MIRRVGPVTPSRLGLHLEFELEKASGHVTRPLKKLVEVGLIVKDATNQRVVRYKNAHEILPPIVIKNDEHGLIYKRLNHENS